MNDPSIERAVLAGISRYNSDGFDEVSDLINSNAFTEDISKCIYKCFSHIFENDKNAIIDYPSILSAAKTIGLSSEIANEGDVQFIRAVLNMPVEKSNVRKFAAKLKRLEVGRLIESQLRSALNNVENITGDEPIAHILGLAENPIFDLTSSLIKTGDDGPSRIGHNLRSYIQNNIDNPVQNVGISTGFPEFDRAIGGGLRPKTISVIAARAKQGKTVLADNVSHHVSSTLGLPVLNLDTEMAKEDHWNRMIAMLSGVDINEIEQGGFGKSAFKKEKVFKAITTLEKAPYDYFSIAGQPFEETLAYMRRWVTKTVGIGQDGLAKPCLIVFDYLKLMSNEIMENKNIAEYQVLGFMMTALHNFMVKWGTRCLAFVQLNRDGIDKESSDVVAQSDRIVWLCSNLSIFKPKTVEEKAEQTNSKKIYNRKMIPIATRHGPGLEDGDYINMDFQGNIAKITEGPTRNKLSTVEHKNEGFVLNDNGEQIPGF